MIVIKVKERNSIVLTNISYGLVDVSSIININGTLNVLSPDNGVYIYNKKYKKK